jgi:hypothetical protein
MDFFFARNCYTEAERSRVKAWRPYQVAMEQDDIVQAQEIVTCVLEQGLGLPPNFVCSAPSPGEI